MPLINIREQKRQLRAECRRIRASCPPELKRELDRRITERVLALDAYRECGTLFCFVSQPIECDTHSLIETALSEGRRVAVPKCLSDSGEMDFYYINSLAELKKGFYGLLEPDPETAERATDYSRGLCIVPGLCFDYQGYRIGFGKGYYDRFLSVFNGVTVGVCYTKCVRSEVPHGIYDRAADILVTEKYTNVIS